MFSDGPHSLAVKLYDHVVTNGDSVLVGERMTVTSESNPGKKIIRWKKTTTNEFIGAGDSIPVSEKLVGELSLKVVVCNIIPITTMQRAHTLCSSITVNITIISKCVSVIFILDFFR